ncbi:hypothetical protein ACWT_7923 [Actinoplanes sp. SE50]|uniref:DUF4291 domain-containing protein n=1 Tax=unclassified Actinoplanes TaxID=2626549 RepID=UPI00023EDFF6|nr:hypothetical protein ACPL_8054 [Actinoplanes sp. SE50/110]ATO87338.1 hypothetical protein ACWT_7923 [Actinoplanes sp. SE50]SLM04756.1 uncharacterized protein ACSP50_8064 [Actinoplanes sp. SE50/110]
MHEIRAVYDEHTITVYQAYSPAIAVPAVRAGRFVPPFKRERMTWIKPSFLWMMYRCGWATKEGQEHVLAVSITREGFEWALTNAVHSSYVRGEYPSRDDWQRELRRAPARVQWDPERDLRLRALPYRSLQLGLGGEAAIRYADEWITGISDVTDRVREIRGLLDAGQDARAAELLPPEHPYPVVSRTPTDPRTGS